jgi:hypothetical protein
MNKTKSRPNFVVTLFFGPVKKPEKKKIGAINFPTPLQIQISKEFILGKVTPAIIHCQKGCTKQASLHFCR